ncbi:MAG TPA: hypothetical protein EYP56_07030 [Planctomycetaceae bacterium]|nr:hypothetical protein [Planctomycetaceae bacterium]HIQ20969.1 hypothetical protein [Planctomycetota bacterium]
MISRILGTASTLLVYFLAATVVAEALILGYLWSAWGWDRQRWLEILAAAQGITPEAETRPAGLQQEIEREEPSYEEILQQRAARFRDLELREQALNTALDQLKAEEQQLAQQQQKFERVSAQFTAQLEALSQGAKAQGREQVRAILESLKPAQAKIQLVTMLDQGEIDEVVLLLRDMQGSKRAKILAEFKDQQDNKKVAEVLRRIREGEPEASIIQEARRQLGQPPSGS